MSLAQPIRFDFGWRRSNLTALVVLALAATVALAVGEGKGRIRVRSRPPVDRNRLAAAEEKINPNTAGVGLLRRLPGIGPVKAQAIVDYRAVRGGRPFARAEDLDNVEGLGKGAVERLRPYLEFFPGF
jgi:competence ComEA-like helix-hairpin-helix protein